MAVPKNQEQFNEMFLQNCRVEGFGAETKQILACPFCATPDFMEILIVNAAKSMKNGGTCKVCGRSAKAEFQVEDPSNVQFEIVQTGGKDPPKWMTPKMRRITE